MLKNALYRLEDHETRIRAGERWRNFLTGAWAVVSLLLGAIFFGFRE
jgi:hypothetical protein